MTIFNDKTCKAIVATTPEVKENPNKYIPDKIKKEEDESKTCDDKKEGRGIFYTLALFATPTYKSVRTEEKQKSRVVDKELLDKLCNDLETMLTTKTTEEESATSDESSSSDEESSETDKKSCKENDEECGRVDTTTFNYRTCKTYNVRRSARIAKKY